MRLGSVRWVIAILSAGPMLAASCESLRSLSLPHASVTSAQAVGAGAFTAPEAGGFSLQMRVADKQANNRGAALPTLGLTVRSAI